jgi:hypothetical protein
MTSSYVFLKNIRNKFFKLSFDRATIGGKRYGIGIVSAQNMFVVPLRFRWTVWSSSSENNGSIYSGRDVIYHDAESDRRNEYHFTFPINDGIDYFASVELVYDHSQCGEFLVPPSENKKGEERLFETFRAEGNWGTTWSWNPKIDETEWDFTDKWVNNPMCNIPERMEDDEDDEDDDMSIESDELPSLINESNVWNFQTNNEWTFPKKVVHF